ncbi:maelstrom-like protein [Lamellibrachia satsuma]|nr:maelstrom-like protein [Lamellibrachia satsuma]
MPKKKQARNAFYWFMQDIIPDLRREGRVFPNGMQDVVPVATPRWKALSEADRERYENKAKLEKKRARQSGSGRMDNIGNIIGDRGDEQAELERRRVKEKKWTSTHWPKGDEIKDAKFYFISFEYLCETEEGEFLPCEVGLIEWSLNQGITKTLHRFINPGVIPLGYRYTCQSHSDDTHQIPVSGFELADSDYRGLWIQMENFVNPNGEKEDYPPIFFLGNERKTVEYCMDWLHAHACLGIPNRLHRLFILENMIVELYAHKLTGETTPPPTRSAVVEMLTTSVFDYEANTRCPWHEEQQVRYCALGTVKRFTFALSDALAQIYDFELTPAHLPTRSDDVAVAYTIIPPSAIQLDRTPIGGRGSRGRGSRQGRGDMGLQNGGYASRDVRYRELQEGRGSSEGGRGPPKTTSAWSGEQRVAPGEQRAAPPSPWRRPNQEYTPSESQSEWPTLGGGTTNGRFAGRAQAPAPTDLPTPGWQPNKMADTEDRTDNRPTLGQAVQQRQDSRPTLGQAVQQRQDSRPTLGQAVQQTGQMQPPSMQQQQVCGRGMGILAPGVWAGQAQRPGMMPQNPPASNPWGAPRSQLPASVNPLAGLGRGRGLFTGQPTRPTGPGNPAQPGITRPPPGFGLGISDQFTGLGLQSESQQQ